MQITRIELENIKSYESETIEFQAGTNAIVDALSEFGIEHIDTPCTPYKVWKAIHDAQAG